MPGFLRRARWRWALGSFLIGVVYTGLSLLAGVELRFGERDVTVLGGGVVEVSFAVFGYLIGLTREARDRDRRHLEELAALRARLTHHEKLASLGQLAGVIAHEVRNPLAILRAQVQNLEEELPASAEGRETCALLLEEIDRLANVTRSILAFARPLTVEPRPIEMGGLGERLRQLTAPLFATRGLELRLGPASDLVADPMRFEADPDLLCQVLLGLLENAAALAPAESAIELGWSGEEGRVELWVADRGPGVPEEDRERIFEPFVSLREGGHGLGLAVARQIVTAHRGRLEVDDHRGGGALFRVVLPQGSDPMAASAVEVA